MLIVIVLFMNIIFKLIYNKNIIIIVWILFIYYFVIFYNKVNININ